MLDIIYAVVFQALQVERLRIFAGYVFSTMIALASPDLPRFSRESPEAMAARYREISFAIAAAAEHPEPWEQRRRAAILLGIARHEAGLFELDVDTGPCRTAVGDCDHGRSVSLWQLLELNPERRRRYQHDRVAAAARALSIALNSSYACPHAPYARYASGTCEGGHEASAELEANVRHAALRLDAVIAASESPYGR